MAGTGNLVKADTAECQKVEQHQQGTVDESKVPDDIRVDGTRFRALRKTDDVEGDTCDKCTDA